MDTSPEYIKKCQKAEEIQAINPCPKLGSWHGEKGNIHMLYESSTVYAFGDGFNVWLPRQDQLQEMLPGKTFNWLHKLWDFSQESYEVDWNSMEQLWLAAIMDWKFAKQWNGSEWIKKQAIEERLFYEDE